MKYPFKATVQRVVTDEITIVVEADSEQEASDKAHDVLLVYPGGHIVEGVGYCYVENRHNGDASVISLERTNAGN